MDTFEAFAAARFSPGITADGVALVEDRLVPGGRAIAKRASTPLERAALVREVELSTSLALDAAPAVLAFVERTEHATVYFERASGVSIGEARLTSRELQEVAVDLLEALGAAHDRGFVHGDLKPEHVIVEVDRGAPKVRLIDWGLAAPLGSPARGGSHGYLAPELLEGAPAGIATDLYAFGATMRPAIHSDDAAARALRALCDQCVAAPSDRPTSVWAALAMIGIVRPDPGARRTAPLPGPIDEDPIGQSFSVEGPSGSGRTHFVQRAVRHAIARRRPIVGLRCEAGYDPIQWIADVLGFHVSIDAERRASRAGTLLGRMGVTLVLDDVDHLDEDGVVSASAAARAIRAESNGRVLYVGPGELLAAELVAAGASRIALEPLGARETESMLEDVGARSDDATVREVMRATHGLAGHVGRIALALGRSPELGVDDALAHAIPPVDSRRGLEAIDSIAMARGLITRAPRRAATILRNAAIEPGDAAERDRLLAQAEMSSGRLRAAETIYAELVMKAAPSERARAELDHARVLERLGRHVDARASALRALGGDDVEIHGDAAVIAAQSTLALGDPTGAAQLAGRGLEVARDAVVRARLHALVSDATLRTHRLEEALVAATAAVAEARRSNDPAASAHAAARVAAAHGLSGNPAGAREAWADALRNAEAASDVTALPPFVMNLATADHAMGEYGAARDGYSRAAHLAERLGRTASLASALTNLGGLLASLSSFEEARAVLGRARTAASSAGAKLFEAQCDLIEAETWVLESPEWAQSLTARAKTAFETIGAARQAVEATVLEAEIVLERRDAPRAAEIVSRIVDEADKAGLGSRVALVLGRSRMLENDLDGARRSVDDALRLARAAADKPVEARALELHAELHDRMGTGAGDHHREEARLVVAHIAARIPTGLRERYLERRAVRIDPPKARALAGARLGQDGRRLLGLVARTLRERDEERVIETALDEAVSMTRAEHAFLLRKKENGRPTVEAARNFDRETIQNSRFRFSKSVAERVLASGEPVMAASAPTDPTLAQSRSVLDLGLLSILCVPIRGDGGIIGALYLDHRFEQGRFTDEDREVIQSLADVVGLALEQARLRGEAEARTDELRRAHESLRIESAQKDIELTRLLDALARGASATELDETKIVGRSLAVRSQIDIARRVAKTDLAVLIEGESGTGKELFARLVHDKSPRVRGPFLAINCGALPENLIESELFGHVRGAFTGATHDHVGLFRAAHGGTLFLDEVGELPLRVQTRLLRVLQERVLTALGSVVGQSIDVRIVAATNRDLDVEVEEGRFRRDLFFRLAGVRLRLPALRDRADDVLAVAAALLDRIGAEPGLRRVKLSRGAARALLDHHWPGNVRELEHALRRAVALSDGEELEAAHLSLDRGSSTVPRREARRSLDAEMVSKALAESGGNRTEAARSLGISRITMQRLVAKMGAAPAARGRPKRK